MPRIPPKPLLLTLALAAGAVLGAQDPPPAAPATAGAAAAELAGLEQAYREARSAYAEAAAKQRARRKDDPGAELAALAHPDPEFAIRFREAAKRHAGSKPATTMLIRALELTYRRDEVAAKEVLAELLEDHMASEQLPAITTELRIGVFYLGADTVRAAMNRIVEESPHDVVKAAFLHARASLVVRARESTAEERDAAVRDLERAMTLGAGTHYAEQARAAKYELEHLQVGLSAPEIEGTDLDGVAFKLSDYRGKVVVLDFWGDW